MSLSTFFKSLKTDQFFKFIYIFSLKIFFTIGFGETIDIAHEMAARDSLRQMFGTSDNILLPFNLELNQLRESASKNVFVNEWSQKIQPVKFTHFELRQVKKIMSN